MFGIHCPTGLADSLGYVLSGFALSWVSPPIIFDPKNRLDFRDCLGKKKIRELLLLLLIEEVSS